MRSLTVICVVFVMCSGQRPPPPPPPPPPSSTTQATQQSQGPGGSGGGTTQAKPGPGKGPTTQGPGQGPTTQAPTAAPGSGTTQAPTQGGSMTTQAPAQSTGAVGPVVPSSIVFVPLEGGEFTMGMSTSDTSDARYPAHSVTLSPFEMSEAEITNDQYVQFLNEAMSAGKITVADETVTIGLTTETATFVFGVGDFFDGKKFIELSGTRVLKDHTGDGIVDPENPLNLCWIGYDASTNAFSIKDPSAQDWDTLCTDVQTKFGMTPDRADWDEINDPSLMPTQSEVSQWPATFIQWYGAYAFTEFYGISLPTEAQWEYAAKGGQDLLYATDDGTISEAKASYNPGGVGTLATGHVEAVKSFPPNPFGLYEMSGNSWEWCLDWYAPYPSEAVTDPLVEVGQYGSTLGNEPTEDDADCTGLPGGLYTCDTRVKRGSSWNYHHQTLQSTYRASDYTFRGNDHFGFRVVRNA